MNIALKEWDLVISALLSGRQTLLLRKGGILESDNQFELEHQQFLFYPTFVHQDPRMVKPAFRAAIRAARTEPEQIEIKGYGTVARICEVPTSDGRARLDSLNDLHIWDAPLLDMRFAYRPEKPLYLVAVRAYLLPQPAHLQNAMSYAGCKSWVPLEHPISLQGAHPALPDHTFTQTLDRIQHALTK